MGANAVRNPFGVEDVPSPFDQNVIEYSKAVALDGASDDANAAAWTSARERGANSTLEGRWESRWNGAADPTIAGDTAERWKLGAGELQIAQDRIYLKFDWNGGVRQGLIEARREGARLLVGKYINLSNPGITRPWIGLIVDNERIDGRFPEGRLDFRR